MHPSEVAVTTPRSSSEPGMGDPAKTSMSRRLFMKRTGGATAAAAIAPPGNLLMGHHPVVFYQYRLFVSEAPGQDDFFVGWMTGPDDEDRVQWSLMGDGPSPVDSSYSELKPIVGAIHSPFAKATAKSTPQLKRGEDLYDGSWLSPQENRESPPKLRFHHESAVELAPEDKSSSVKVEKSVIEAKLSRLVPTGPGTSNTAAPIFGEPQVKWVTEDGREFPSQAAAEAHVTAHGNASIPALEIVSVSTKQKRDELGGRFETREEDAHSYTKSTDGQGRVKLTRSPQIQRRATGLARVVWKIEVQRRTRREVRKDGGEIALEYTEWKVVERSP